MILMLILENLFFSYSLRDGIKDGYLAPYSIKRFKSNIDVFGITTHGHEQDVSGQTLPSERFEEKRF